MYRDVIQDYKTIRFLKYFVNMNSKINFCRKFTLNFTNYKYKIIKNKIISKIQLIKLFFIYSNVILIDKVYFILIYQVIIYQYHILILIIL